MLPTLPARELNLFLSLARAGCHAWASSGEHAAYRLAQAVLDDAPTFDETTLRGLVTFIGLSKYAPERCRELLEASGEEAPVNQQAQRGKTC